MQPMAATAAKATASGAKKRLGRLEWWEGKFMCGVFVSVVLMTIVQIEVKMDASAGFFHGAAASVVALGLVAVRNPTAS
jgi:hypothetical protein